MSIGKPSQIALHYHRSSGVMKERPLRNIFALYVFMFSHMLNVLVPCLEVFNLQPRTNYQSHIHLFSRFKHTALKCSCQGNSNISMPSKNLVLRRRDYRRAALRSLLNTTQ